MDAFVDLLPLPLSVLRERVEQEVQENPVLEVELPTATDETEDETADVVVDQSDDGEYGVRSSDHSLLTLFISKRYTELYQDPATEPRLREYLGRKLQSARRLQEALERRRATLQRVAEAIFRQQRAFLERGPDHLMPLRTEGVAGEVGTDVLTVIRAVQGKHVRTRHGIFALDRFVLDRFAMRRPGPSDN
jgi:RNA polymerase sigma-54 factor